MKIINILSLCLTASLSFAHSTLFYGERGDAFAYDDSGLCADIPDCDLTLINRIPQNINFWLDTIRYPKILSSAPPENFLAYLPSRVASGNYFGFASETDQNTHFYYHPLTKLSSQADANAYFNIHILNNTPSNQLGYLRWITYKFSDSIKSYMINLGATTTEHLAPPLFPLYKTPNDTTDNTFTYKYLWLCNDVINCQFIKRSDICSTILTSNCDPRHALASYPNKCPSYSILSFLFIPPKYLGFSSEADANINTQIFDSPVFLENE